MALPKKIVRVLKWFLSPDCIIMAILLILLSSVAGYYIQDVIQRQRYLELLQLEINQNYIEAGQVIRTYNEKQALLNHTPYSSKVYEAGLDSGYILTLNPETLGKISVFYNTYQPKINAMDNNTWSVIEDANLDWQKCLQKLILTKNINLNCDQEKFVSDFIREEYSKYLAQSAVDFQKTISTIKFNPTQDRLKSPILSFLMGTKRLKVQE